MELKLNTDEMDAVFAKLSDRLSDMTEVMGEIGELMVQSTKQNFVDGSDPDGNPWMPKSQTTLDAYAARGETVSTKPLIGPSKELSRTIFSQPQANSVSWGSSLVYAAVQQFGAQAGQFGATIGTDKNGREYFTSTPWGDIPARPFIGVGESDELAIIETISEWLDDVDLP